MNVQRVGLIGSFVGYQQLPADLAGGNNSIFDLNEDDPNNDGLGQQG